MRVNPIDLDVLSARESPERIRRFTRGDRQAKLRIFLTRLNVLMGMCRHPGRDTKEDVGPTTRPDQLGQAVDLVVGVDHDLIDANVECVPQFAFRFVVAVQL